MISPVQGKKISRMFEVLDVDRDGYLTLADRERVIHALLRERGWPQGGPEHQKLRQAYGPMSEAMDAFRDSAGRVDRGTYLSYHDAMLNAPGAYDATIRS